MIASSPRFAWPRQRPETDPFEGVDEDGFFVFLPAIMSVGVVFSVVTLIRDAFRRTGSKARERRTTLEAHAVVQDLIGQAVPLTAHPYRLGVGPPWWLTAATFATGLISVIVTLTVATGRGLTESIDKPIVDRLTDVAWLERLDVVDPFGSTLVTIAFVALIGLSSFRCRVMAFVYPAAFAMAWISVEILQDVVSRTRPSGFDTESFPSGHIVQVVFIAGLLPPALDVLLANQRLVRASRAILVAAVVATSIHRIHLAKHWPLDIVGGLAIGATVVLASYWVLEHRGWHQRCPSCRWSPHPGSVPWERGVINLRQTTARRVGITGSVLALGAAGALGIATLWIGLPEDPEGSGLGSAISAPAQLGLAGLVAVAGLLALRWKAIGAFVMAIAAVGLGVFSSVQYVPQLAFLLTASLLIPAFLLWLSWQPTATMGSIAALALVTATTLTGTGLGVREVHEHYFGPTHPSSLAEPLDSDADWLWLGGVDDHSATITAGEFTPGAAVDLQYWPAAHSRDESHLVRVFADPYGIVRFDLAELDAATSYLYRVLAFDGDRVNPTSTDSEADASFETFASGSQNLEIVIGACARRSSNARVFDAIVGEEPDLYLALGDLHYGNLESADPGPHIREYGRSLGQPAQAALFGSVATAYIWDDHDYGGNDASRDSASRDAVSTAYRAAVPHYGVDPDVDASIAQAFTLGRVRFIVTDTRSMRDESSMLGTEQLAWFLDELVEAATDHAMVVWVNPAPWIGPPVVGGDSWASYGEERAQISQIIADNEISNLIMVSGDAHMVALDDGSNTGYGIDGSGGFPLLHGGALDRPGSVKGGPYSHGTFPGGGQYGRINIADDGGDTLTVRLSGHQWDGTELVALEFTID